MTSGPCRLTMVETLVEPWRPRSWRTGWRPGPVLAAAGKAGAAARGTARTDRPARAAGRLRRGLRALACRPARTGAAHRRHAGGDAVPRLAAAGRLVHALDGCARHTRRLADDRDDRQRPSPSPSSTRGTRPVPSEPTASWCWRPPQPASRSSSSSTNPHWPRRSAIRTRPRTDPATCTAGAEPGAPGRGARGQPRRGVVTLTRARRPPRRPPLPPGTAHRSLTLRRCGGHPTYRACRGMTDRGRSTNRRRRPTARACRPDR
jgi:hypothetical protein